MIRKCTVNDLNEMVDLAFELNNQKEHHSAFCYLSKDSIRTEFESSVTSEQSLMIGKFNDNQLTGLLACYIDREKGNGDCSGPFIDIKKEDYKTLAKELFQFAKDQSVENLKYTFFFAKENQNCKDFLESVNAVRRINEYELLLKNESFIPSIIATPIGELNDMYHDQFVQLHDSIFPEVYVSGKDIIGDKGKDRNVFTLIKEDKIVAYSVLKAKQGANTGVAEIIGVDEPYRGNGYGKAILSHLINVAFQDYKIEDLILIVDGDNETAISLYLSLGFTVKAENCCYIAN